MEREESMLQQLLFNLECRFSRFTINSRLLLGIALITLVFLLGIGSNAYTHHLASAALQSATAGGLQTGVEMPCRPCRTATVISTSSVLQAWP
ncbi:MAG: hypothetical protein AB2606_08035 [Candidatus Thiodiazotropha taylori]